MKSLFQEWLNRMRAEPFGMAMPGRRLPKRVRQILSGNCSAQMSIRRTVFLSFVTALLSGVFFEGALTGGQQALTSFDVASIRRNESGSGYSHFSADHGKLTATNELLKDFIREAYAEGHGPLQESRIVGAPEWTAERRYDIEAKLDESVTAEWEKLSQDEQETRMHLAEQALRIGSSWR